LGGETTRTREKGRRSCKIKLRFRLPQHSNSKKKFPVVADGLTLGHQHSIFHLRGRQAEARKKKRSGECEKSESHDITSASRIAVCFGFLSGGENQRKGGPPVQTEKRLVRDRRIYFSTAEKEWNLERKKNLKKLRRANRVKNITLLKAVVNKGMIEGQSNVGACGRKKMARTAEYKV